MYDPWNARNNYIDVVLDRNPDVISKFQRENFRENLTYDDKVLGMKLLEIQRQAMLMYTSCGWFFAEISGIETVQLMKYAARAMQLAKDFSDEDLQFEFLEILAKAKSNIAECGTGKDVFEKYVVPSVVTINQIANLWRLIILEMSL